MTEKDSVPAQLKKLRERAGLSMAAVAKGLKYKGSSSYQRYENEDLFTKPQLPLPLVRSLVDILAGKGSPPITREEVLMLAGLKELTGPQVRSLDEHRLVWCIGEVAAGIWRDTFEWQRDEWQPVLISIDDTRYPDISRRALRVRGDSMDMLYPEGSYVIYVRFSEIGRGPQPGERVVVLRHRHGQTESTVKEYTKDAAKRRWLLPRSSNPAYTAFRIDAPSEPDEHIEVLGLIVGSQRIE